MIDPEREEVFTEDPDDVRKLQVTAWYPGEKAGEGRVGRYWDREGIMGWSFGGASAMEGCLADSRFRTGINIDGTPYGEFFNSGYSISQPFMMIRNQTEDELEQIIGDLVFINE